LHMLVVCIAVHRYSALHSDRCTFLKSTLSGDPKIIYSCFAYWGRCRNPWGRRTSPQHFSQILVGRYISRYCTAMGTARSWAKADRKHLRSRGNIRQSSTCRCPNSSSADSFLARHIRHSVLHIHSCIHTSAIGILDIVVCYKAVLCSQNHKSTVRLSARKSDRYGNG
jgi:hypothetical protein